jgi:inorganic pyrophosphatase/manganese-dependent inorganic pyrophosphatase
MKIITVGDNYLDIDGYGGIIAYTELCNLLNNPAKAVCPAPFNASITKTVKTWPAELFKTYENPSSNDTFTVIDLSDPNYTSSFVDIDRIDEIIDHHPGFEQFWLDKIGNRAQIELVGAACTLVYERWVEKSVLSKMSQTSARLLICGILDNTLNFGAKITTERDINAYKNLINLANLPKNWPEIYFNEIDEYILKNPIEALINDSKTPVFKTYNEPILFAQLAVWDVDNLLHLHHTKFIKTLKNKNINWAMNTISISQKKSYFLTDNSNIQNWLSKLLGIEFIDNLAIAGRPWLRKEIIKQDLL